MKTEFHNTYFIYMFKKKILPTHKGADNTWICGDTTTIPR